ncbi:MAG: ABC transporter substrate-binding protein [Propionibacterium sp.]|nr:ABC transporter substrate-binding protein [Propionibacterium sp.]
MKRRTLVGLAMAATLLAACAGGAAEPTAAPTDEPTVAESVSIGAVTIVSHPSLDLIYEGIKEGLADAGYIEGENLDIRLENPQGDQTTLASIANTLANGDQDLYVAIATPPAQALAQVIQDRPIVFASVTDPVSAELVDSMDAPGGNITGTSDQIPPDQQLEVMLEILPELSTLGIVYSSAEVNAEVQAAGMREVAEAAGITVEVSTVINSSEVYQAAESLDVDAYWVGNDNAVVSAIESIVQVAEANDRFLFTSDADSVERGAGASYSTDYHAQGLQTARMIVQILDGAAPADVPVEIQESLELTVNPAAAERMGVTLSDEVIAQAANVIE